MRCISAILLLLLIFSFLHPKEVEDQEERNKIIKRELDEAYYATLKKATETTDKYYTPAMHKLNRYISFSFISILIVLLNIGFLELFSLSIIEGIFVFPFDIAIIFILIYGLIFGFDKTTEVKDFFLKNLLSIDLDKRQNKERSLNKKLQLKKEKNDKKE